MIVGFLALVSTAAAGADQIRKLARHTLSGGEQAVFNSAVTERRRRDFVAGRCAAKLVLEAVDAGSGRSSRGWRAVWPPHVSPCHPGPSDFVSISHVDGLAVALAPLERRRAAVDLERRERRPKHVADLFSACESEPVLEQWMLKEICAKIAGVSLAEIARTIVTVRLGHRFYVAFGRGANAVRRSELFATTHGLPICIGLDATTGRDRPAPITREDICSLY